jgi:lysophospholipase L1-like esterase
VAIALTLACHAAPTAPMLPPPPPEEPSVPAPPAPPVVPPHLNVERILTFGNSLTEGESTGTGLLRHDPGTPGVSVSYPFKLQALIADRYTAQAISVFNGGKGGERVTEAQDRFDDLIGDLSPQVVILMTGVNDLNGGVPITTIIDAVEDLIRSALARGIDVILSTIPRQIPEGRRADSAERVDPYNAQLAALALDEGVPLADIHPHLTEAFITPDGLHITEAGNQRLAEIYFEILMARYEAASTTRR